MRSWIWRLSLCGAVLLGVATVTLHGQGDLTTVLTQFLTGLRNGFVVYPVQASDPSTVQEGAFWYNSTSHLFKFYNGSTATTVGSSSTPTTVTGTVTDANVFSAATAHSTTAFTNDGQMGGIRNGASGAWGIFWEFANQMKSITVSNGAYAWASTTGTDVDASTFRTNCDTALSRNGAGVVEVTNCTANTYRDLKVRMLRVGQTTVPTCTGSCGTSPSVVGSDSAMLVTMGATGVPASPFTVTFNGTWAAAPVCTATAGTAQTARYVTAAVTSTTTVAVTTATAPSTSDKFNIICIGQS